MFSLRFKELRENMGLSQREVALNLNISPSTVGMWESGAREPRNLKELQRIADYFAVSTDYLIGRDNNGFPIDTQEKPNGVWSNFRLKEIRLEKDVSQRELALALGLSPNTLSQYENRKRDPNITTLGSIADYFDVTTDYLLGRDEKKPTPEVEDGQERPPVDTDERRLNEELIQRLCSLTPEELGKVDAFVQGLLASR